MLQLIPRPAHRAALTIAHRLRQAWWRLRKPALTGCRVLAFDDRGRVLMVRHSYGSGRWMLPGGGVRTGEDPLAAAVREFREEVSCGLSRAAVFGTVDEPLSGTTNHVHLVCGLADGDVQADGREIIEARFFAATAIPADSAAAIARGLPGWITAAEAALRRPPAAR